MTLSRVQSGTAYNGSDDNTAKICIQLWGDMFTCLRAEGSRQRAEGKTGDK